MLLTNGDLRKKVRELEWENKKLAMQVKKQEKILVQLMQEKVQCMKSSE